VAQVAVFDHGLTVGDGVFERAAEAIAASLRRAARRTL
jgi:hypothetical protein